MTRKKKNNELGAKSVQQQKPDKSVGSTISLQEAMHTLSINSIYHKYLIKTYKNVRYDEKKWTILFNGEKVM